MKCKKSPQPQTLQLIWNASPSPPGHQTSQLMHFYYYDSLFFFNFVLFCGCFWSLIRKKQSCISAVFFRASKDNQTELQLSFCHSNVLPMTKNVPDAASDSHYFIIGSTVATTYIFFSFERDGLFLILGTIF